MNTEGETQYLDIKKPNIMKKSKANGGIAKYQIKYQE